MLEKSSDGFSNKTLVAVGDSKTVLAGSRNYLFGKIKSFGSIHPKKRTKKRSIKYDVSDEVKNKLKRHMLSQFQLWTAT